MTVEIYENKSNGKIWTYNVTEDQIVYNIKSYEIFDYDELLKNIIAIDIAIKNIFGEDTIFIRDMSIRNYIIGNVYKENNIFYKDIVIVINFNENQRN